MSDVVQNISGAASFGPFHLQWSINWHRGRVMYICFGSHLQRFGGNLSSPILEDHVNPSLLLVQPGVAFAPSSSEEQTRQDKLIGEF